MSAMWVMYLADIVGGLSTMFLLVAVVFGIACLLSCLLYMDSSRGSDNEKSCIKTFKVTLPICLFAALVSILIPSKQTIYMMAAAKVGQDIVTSPETKDVSSKVLKLINQKLDEQLAPKENKK